MDVVSANLKEQLERLHNRAGKFFVEAEKEISAEYGDVHPFNLWHHLSKELRVIGEALRAETRALMNEIGQQATHSILIDDADLIDLGKNTKKISASLRFRQFRSWGITIHHDEGDYIGSDPPGQEETDVSIATAKKDYQRAYTATAELLELISAKNSIPASSSSTSNRSSLVTYRPGSAFIMMWIDPNNAELSDVQDVVKEVFKEFGVQALRADDLQHADGITERIIEEIRQSEFLFADLTGERPSVYYEVGYAHSLGKSVILFRKSGTKIHFDLAYRNCPEYNNIGDLKQKLRNRMSALTNKNSGAQMAQ